MKVIKKKINENTIKKKKKKNVSTELENVQQ